MKIVRVKCNGHPVALHEIRVSAHPINRVWPGYQRNPSQAERAWFVQFDQSKPTALEIEFADEPPTDLEVRPFSLGLTPERSGPRTVRLHLAKPAKFTLAPPDGHHALHVFADEPLHCEPQPGDLYFGPGEHDVGVIMPQSGQTVVIDSGAVVYGMIFCYQADDVRVVGHGILDSSRLKCPKEAIASEPGGELMAACQKLGFGFHELYVGGQVVVWGSHHFTMRGVTMVDSPSWTVCVRNDCKDVLLEDLNIVGQWRYNSDGIDICASSRVIIRNCFIRTFDDCIILRAPWLFGETPQMAVEDVMVEKCVLWCDWGMAMKTWCGELPCRIQKCRFQDIDVIRIAHYAIFVTTKYGSADSLVEDISWKDIRLDTDDFYPAPMLQASDEMTFPEHPAPYEPYALVLDHGPLGHDTGNQGVCEAVDLSGYRLCYRNLRVENLRCSKRKLPVCLAPDAQLAIEDIALLKVDCNRLEERGPVHALKVCGGGADA